MKLLNKSVFFQREPRPSTSSHQGVTNHQSWRPLDAGSTARRRRWVRIVIIVITLALLAGASWAYWQYQVTPQLGRITETVRGRVMIQDNILGPQIQAEVDRIVRPGARVYAESNAIAVVTFFDDSAFRVESEGIWLVSQINGSRNDRLSRIAIRHVQGDALYVSRLPQPGVDSVFRVTLVGGAFALDGVAKLSVWDDEIIITLLQGQAVLESGDGAAQATLTEGRSATLVSGYWQPL